jgi:hypothetical protein
MMVGLVPVVAARVADQGALAAEIRAVHGLGEHHHADQPDQPVAGEAHAGNLGRGAAERPAQDQIGQRDDHHRRENVEHRDLQAHQEAAHDPGFVRQEIRHDHDLAMPGPERMHHAVKKGKPDADQQRHRRLALTDRPHVLGDHSVRLALEGQERPPDERDRPPGAPGFGRLIGRGRGRLF